MSNFIDLTGQRFGSLTVIERIENTKDTHARWMCMCDCGKNHTASSNNLRRGHLQSCGCYRKERATKHGASYTSTYTSWRGMIERCTNQKQKSYADYGGRGISVCERWLNFKDFLADMGERPGGHTLDRIDSNGNYEPDNCRWVTSKEQNSNKSSNRYIMLDGERMTMTEYARRIGVRYQTVSSWLKSGKLQEVP